MEKALHILLALPVMPPRYSLVSESHNCGVSQDPKQKSTFIITIVPADGGS